MDKKSFRITLAFSVALAIFTVNLLFDSHLPRASGQTTGNAGSVLGSASNSVSGLSGQVAQTQANLASTQASLANSTSSPSSFLPHVGGTGQRQFPILKYLKARHAANKANFRSSPLAKLVNGIRKPISQLTGGLLPAQPHPNAVQMAAPGPQGSAAKIKKDQLEAPKRLTAIRELGKVDCHWYPEAQLHLVLALRTDRSECVRYEAAKILAEGNCCGGPVIHALRICVAGTEADGNPGERSSRIREQAAVALERCLANQSNLQVQPLLERPEYPVSPIDDSFNNAPPHTPSTGVSSDPNVAQASYLNRSSASNNRASVDEVTKAKLTLRRYRDLAGGNPDQQGASSAESSLVPVGRPKSLSDVWERSKRSP